jgi:hypothetical protein
MKSLARRLARLEGPSGRPSGCVLFIGFAPMEAPPPPGSLLVAAGHGDTEAQAFRDWASCNPRKACDPRLLRVVVVPLDPLAGAARCC